MGFEIAKERQRDYMVWSSYLCFLGALITLVSIFSSEWIVVTYQILTIIEVQAGYGVIIRNVSVGGVSSSGGYGECEATDTACTECKKIGEIAVVLAFSSLFYTLWGGKILRKRVADNSQAGLQSKCMWILGLAFICQFLSWFLMMLQCGKKVSDYTVAQAAANEYTTASDATLGIIGLLAVLVNIFQVAGLVANKGTPEGAAIAAPGSVVPTSEK
jgi:hypothetical protein